MADNVPITAGTGTTIAADEVVDGTLGTVKMQYIKIADGTLDGTTKATVATTAKTMSNGYLLTALASDSVNANGQATMANSAPVVIASNQSAIPATQSGTWSQNLIPATSGGLSRDRYLVPNNTTARVVKSGAGQLYKIRATNNSGTIGYIKLYDATSATAGSGTPVDTIMIPANTSGAGIVDTTDVGTPHATGITYIVTTGIGDADTTAPAANAYVVTLYYK